MIKEQYDKYLDASSALFMDGYFESIKVNPPDEQMEVVKSAKEQRFLKRMKSKIRWADFMNFGGGFLRITKFAVIIAMICATGFVFLFASAEPVQAAVFGYFVQQHDGHLTFSGKEIVDNVPDYADAPEALSFDPTDPLGKILPSDYSLREFSGSIEEGYYDAVYFKNLNEDGGGDAMIVVRCLAGNETPNINTEDAVVEEIQIGEYDALISSANGMESHIIAWYIPRLDRIVLFSGSNVKQEEVIEYANFLNIMLEIYEMQN